MFMANQGNETTENERCLESTIKSNSAKFENIDLSGVSLIANLNSSNSSNSLNNSTNSRRFEGEKANRYNTLSTLNDDSSVNFKTIKSTSYPLSSIDPQQIENASFGSLLSSSALNQTSLARSFDKHQHSTAHNHYHHHSQQQKSYSDNSLDFNYPTKQSDHLHINNNFFKSDLNYCDCESCKDYNLKLSEQCDNRCNQFDVNLYSHPNLDLVNNSDLICSNNINTAYDLDRDYKLKNCLNLDKKFNYGNYHFSPDSCPCNSLVTKQPSLNIVENNLINRNSTQTRSNLNNRYLFEPFTTDQKKFYNNHKPNSQSSPILSSNLTKCACFDCFDLFNLNKSTKLTNSLSDSLFNNLKLNFTSSLLNSSSSSSNLSTSSSFKSSSKSCFFLNKFSLIVKLIRKLYFYVCFLITLLLNLISFRNSKEDQHKLICENRIKIMRLKERIVIFMIAACCVLCTFFILQLKISEDMDSSIKFR